MKRIYNFFAILMLCFLMMACSDSSNSVEPTRDSDYICFASGVNLSPTFDVEGGAEDISFTTSTSWTASLINNRADEWCIIEPTSGLAGTNTINIKVLPNKEPDEKTAVVQIKSGYTTKVINVSQKQKNALTLTSNKYEVEAEGGSVEIEIKANIKYSYSIDDVAKEWIVYEDSRALATSYLKFKVAPNEGLEPREGTITITDGALTETVTIYQQGDKPSIVISQKEYVVDAGVNSIQVEVSSNVDVKMKMPDVDWIIENESRAYSTNSYCFIVSENNTYDNRSAEIVFKNVENNLEEKVVVSQLQKNAIVLAKNEYTLEKDACHLDFDIQANVDFEVKVESEWIKQVESRGLKTYSLYFDILENTEDTERVGKIIISSGSIEQTVTVIQKGQKEDVEEYSDVMMFVDTDLIFEYEISLFNTKDGNLAVIDLDGDGTLNKLLYVSNSLEKTALFHFYKNGLIESVALDSCTIIFSDYKGNNVDVTFVEKGNVHFSKTIETNVAWNEFSLSSPFVFSIEEKASRNVILDIDKWLIENEERFKKLFHTIDQYTNIKNVLNIKELSKGQIEVIDNLGKVIKKSVSDYTLFELGMSDKQSAKIVSFIADVIEFIWDNVGSWQYKTLKLLLTNYSTYSKFCEDIAMNIITAIDKWNNPNKEVWKGTLKETVIAKAVDLGLSVLWASHNVGATKPEEYGGYYAWGETKEKEEYTVHTYQYYKGDLDCDGSMYDTEEWENIGRKISGTQYDVAHMIWGDGWRMPTCEECYELYEKCTREYTEYNGMDGNVVVGPNGNSIFIPASGCMDGKENVYVGYVSFWSGTLGKYDGEDAVCGALGIGKYSYPVDQWRYRGLTIRTVKDK